MKYLVIMEVRPGFFVRGNIYKNKRQALIGVSALDCPWKIIAL